MRVVSIPGLTVPESASCDSDDCEWEYEGDHPAPEAKAHTKETGHLTVVWATKATWYQRRGDR